LTDFPYLGKNPKMEKPVETSDSIDAQIAQRLRALRAERGWSLDDLAARSQVSRSTLSRLENAEVSATASVLGRLCAAYELTLSRLMRSMEADLVPLVPRAEQPVWTDEATGFRRRSVSPPSRTLAGEVLECELAPGARIAYEASPRPGLEHHLVLLEGALRLEVEGRAHDLRAGDCLRYQLHGATVFTTPARQGARYLLFLV